jgi:hypothetical protein
MAKDEARPAGSDPASEREDRPPARDPRPICPSCGSGRTQPFTHGGPAARVNMKCTVCGHLFKEQRPKR